MAQAINRFLDSAEGATEALVTPRTEPLRFAACARCGRTVGPNSVDLQAMQVTCPHCKETSALSLETAHETQTEDGQPETRPAPRPEKTRITILRPREAQLVIHCPPHGLRGAPASLFAFACIWNLFMVAFTALVVAGATKGRGVRSIPLYVAFPFLSVFYAAGVGMLLFGLKGAFSRTLLMVDRERIVLRTIFLGRTKDKSASRPMGTRADLVVAYEQNGCPVYRLHFTGTEIGLGSQLDQAEKSWLMYEINEFIRSLDARA